MLRTTALVILATAAIAVVQANSKSLSVEEICSQLPGGTYILRPNSCNNWVQCPSSTAAQDYEDGFCAYGLYFNKDTNRCETMKDVICPFESSQTQSDTNRCASKKDGIFLADPDRCNGYIFCAKGEETRSTCPKDLIFHPTKSACVYPSDYECPKAVSENVTVSPICQSVATGTIFADITDCTKYHQCVEGAKLKSLQCAEGQAFNHTTLQCVTRSGAVCHPLAPQLEPEIDVCGTSVQNARVGYIADEDSCSAYYICTKQADGTPDRKPTHLKCQDGYFFDSGTWSCRDRLNVKCSLDRCESMSNKYVNVAGDCRAYARCRNGKTASRGECEVGYYFDERTQGCTPQNISYIACSA
ncbi:peritrophin-44-like [Rhagoletis pomonella]|uniref:peritrophin-44-like n=1 Tax=Rhagoletis pomonella TaxID=28610 RepID=UPI00177FF2FC|nr:peritrophin-44-like [Rhagoletis pomonella]